MSEGGQLVVWVIKFVIVGVCAVLYRLGGMAGAGGKFWRRFVMPIVYISLCNGIAIYLTRWSWLLLLPLPFFIGAMSLGYGGDTFAEKLRKRFITGLAVAVAFLPYAFIGGAWGIYALHCLCSIAGSVLLGVFNQNTEGASGEEATIATLYCLAPIMMI